MHPVPHGAGGEPGASAGPSRPSSSAAAPVIVVGAGLSGCAAALALASEGRRSVLVNSGLDSVGLPGYGPELHDTTFPGDGESGGGSVADDPFSFIPPGLREVWRAQAWAVPGVLQGGRNGHPGPDLIVFDRRSVSLGTKWLIENEPLIEIRQATVTSIGPSNTGDVRIETAFGEEMEGSAVLLAVGLALGGRIRVGGQVLPGGRYGEVASDALLEALLTQGIEMHQTTTNVGTRLQSLDPRRFTLEGTTRAPVGSHGESPEAAAPPSGVGLSPVPLRRYPPSTGSGPHGPEPSEEELCRPPSPYEEHAQASVGRGTALIGDPTDAGAVPPMLLPDGVVTGEWYAPPGAVFLDVSGADYLSAADLGPVSRPEHTVEAYVVAAGDGEIMPHVWVAGQAAGVSGYVESMRSGWRSGLSIAKSLPPGAAR